MTIKRPGKLNKIFKKNQVVLAYLFGSEARGESHKESDVDIGVLFDKKVNPKDYLKLEGKLIAFFSEIYSRKEINIVNLNIASPLLKQVAILEGKPLYIRSETDRILFQIQTLREYEDYLHLSNIYNQFLDLKLKAL
ncbi:nucleotidyltransferase domain-containing protein [Patescibacteria group bacterium]|nr:nucleotidyltransferase domain-containing protein [Patescibacteria group bacterium]MBU4056579.1 nucleotidyltransferase domain-containing protein [Patescibacteria group bacterium]MBU4368381.1 nucleotidyltransferase domain-containing protein [Patescibacteria group bacterium]